MSGWTETKTGACTCWRYSVGWFCLPEPRKGWKCSDAALRSDSPAYFLIQILLQILLHIHIFKFSCIFIFIFSWQKNIFTWQEKKIGTQKTETWGSERRPKQTLCLGACGTTRIDLSGPPFPPSSWAYWSRSYQILWQEIALMIHLHSPCTPAPAPPPPKKKKKKFHSY